MSIAIADKKGIVYLSRECVQLGVCLAALYPLTALSLQQDFILIFALASAKDQACYYYDETNQITIGLVSGTPRMHHIRYLKDMLQTLYNAICMEKHDLPIHASMLQMQAGDTKKGLVFAAEEDEHQKRLKETISLAVTGIKELMPRYEDAFKSALIDYENKIYPLISIALEERGEVWLPSLGISKEFLDKVGTDMTGFLEYMNDVLEAFGNALYGIHKRLDDASKLQALFVNVDKKRFQA